MTTFSTFASSFRFLNNPSVSDVQTILNDFNSEVVTNGSPAWTSPSGFTNGTTSGTWKSPVDSAGRFFEILLARTTATRLSFKVLDQNFLTIADREIDISGTVGVNYYTGQYHAWIEALVAASEVGASGICDPAPFPLGTYNPYVYGNGYRNNASTVDSQFSTTGQLFMLDNGGSAMVNRLRDYSQNVNGNNIGLLDAAGNLIYLPSEISANCSGATRWVGKMYQVVAVDSSFAVGTTKTIIIGNAGETGTFRAVGGTLAAIANLRWAVRTA